MRSHSKHSKAGSVVELRERQNFTAAAWDTIRSNAEAENLRNDARLEPTLLTPAELGGLADAANVVLVPPTAREERDRLIAEVLDLVRAGGGNRLSVTSDYRGDSLIPCALAINAWRDGMLTYERRIAIW
jgi:hypothetical protein